MASLRHKRRRSCENKVRHDTETAAASHAKTLGHGIDWYRCRFCGGWHVGHRTKKVRAAVRSARAARKAGA